MIFHRNDTDTALAFKYAVSRFNMFSIRYHVISKPYIIPEADAFETGVAGKQKGSSGVLKSNSS